MFDISVLKEMKLPELQDIAKLAKTIKFNGVKKEALIQMIIAHQAASEANDTTSASPTKATEEKSKRQRIPADKKAAITKEATLFTAPEETIVSNVAEPVEKAVATNER